MDLSLLPNQTLSAQSQFLSRTHTTQPTTSFRPILSVHRRFHRMVGISVHKVFIKIIVTVLDLTLQLVPDYLPIPAYGSSPTGDSTMAMCSGLGSQEDFCLEDHPSPHSPGLSSIAGSADCNSFCSYSSPYTFQHTSPSPSFSSDNINNDLVTPYDSTLVFAPWSDSWLSPDTPPALFSESHSSNTLASIEQLMDQHLVITSPLVQHQPLNEPQPSHTPAKDDSPVLTESIKKSGRTLHKCMFCSHTSNRANNMKEHVRTHDPLRPKNFSCPVCDKKFARKHDMKRHTKSHSRSNVRQPRRKATI
ncbi:hypothetical protein CLU79DRAFT_102698 [Phycomyces nitens]|nr:hypothetical protein CLU79DRAFT_102698 [Phycomyces nitens]